MMPTLLVPSQYVVQQSFVLILDPQQCVCHLQSLDSPAVHACKLPPSILTLCDGFFKPLQLLGHDTESVNLSRERGVVEVMDHPVCLILAFCPQLELLELFSSVHWLPVIMEDGCSVQWLGEYLAAVVAQPDDDGVWVEYDLHILCLLDGAVWSHNGERDEVIPRVRFEPWRDFVASNLVTSLV